MREPTERYTVRVDPEGHVALNIRRVGPGSTRPLADDEVEVTRAVHDEIKTGPPAGTVTAWEFDRRTRELVRTDMAPQQRSGGRVMLQAVRTQRVALPRRRGEG